VHLHAHDDPAARLEEVLVVGEHPGPGLWGDIAALKELIETDAAYARSLAYSWPFLSDDEVRRLHAEAENKLLTAIERAVNRNETTFAALPMHLLLGKDGVVARLRASGYSIDEPTP
jgi:hypothetical protein